jgi:hypothetical protein
MPNGDLSEMKTGQSRRESPIAAAGMLYGQRDLVNAMRELGIGPAPADKSKLTMAAIILAAISPVLTILGGGYFMTSFWRGEDERARAATTVTLRLEVGKKERAELRYANDQLRGRIEGIEKDRAARIAAWETRVDKLEQSVRRLDLVEDSVTRQGKTL